MRGIRARTGLTGPRTGLRGWGGVAAMAFVCALAVVCALLLPRAAGPHTAASAAGGGRTARAAQAEADACTDPQDQSVPPSTAEGTAIAAIKKRGHLSVGVDQNSFNWGYRDPNSTDKNVQLEGFDIDLARRLAKDIFNDSDPARIRFQAIPTTERVPAIRKARVDVVVRTMTITCDRLKDVAFSAPYFVTGQQVLAPKSSDITGYNDTLDGKKVCSAKSSTALDRLTADRKSGELASSVDISTVVPNQLDCLVRLQLGQVDAVLTDGALAASQAAQDPTVELKGDPLTPEYYGVAMKKDATDLEARVNKILEDYRKDGSWADSYRKWLAPTLGADFGPAMPPEPHYRAG
ncbi:transporter substrate-binding domain-containing protein [Streptomyces sp. NPDC008150]|uniref:glutamate ABC transporter substrate-binding protein n=1 Tax=Streptomyces sp. NPDC008150 TaxID=3364816 RepID=UPI0036E58C99